MERDRWSADLSGGRWTTIADAEALSRAHAASWRYAYAGIIPGVALERMISRRGPSWWRRLHAMGGRSMVVDIEDGVAGYALMGRNRNGPGGEIQELYVRPEAQGLGVGVRLFRASQAVLSARAIAPLTIWCLAENRIGCGFYRALGGAETGRGRDRIGGRDLDKIRFTWV